MNKHTEDLYTRMKVGSRDSNTPPSVTLRQHIRAEGKREEELVIKKKGRGFYKLTAFFL
jgi:hypothetical protein